MLFVKKKKNQNNIPKRVAKEAPFSILIYLYFFGSQNACLNFLKTIEEMVWYKKLWRKR